MNLKRQIITPLFAVLVAFSSCTQIVKKQTKFNPNQILVEIGDRIYPLIAQEGVPRLPRSIKDEKVLFTSAKSWTSGFFPGILWMMHKNDSINGERDWLQYAKQYTEKLENLQYETSHHDLGFMLYNSYGKGYQQSSDTTYRNVLLKGAASLASRYDPSIGLIKSWDRPGKWQYPVIIDNMMNLEYLFWASKASGDSAYYELAYKHANNTMEDLYRSDMSCYHVVDYDTLTGEPIWKGTHQGLADESVWARGQAWGLYGFTMAFRETGNKSFLNHAFEIASFLMNHPNMPEDGVPYWDLKDPNIPNTPRDVSAAAVMASALLELSGYSEVNMTKYQSEAVKILTSLSQNYRFDGHEGLRYFYLDQSVGHLRQGKEVSVPIIYADYYFIEALIRLRGIRLKESYN